MERLAGMLQLTAAQAMVPQGDAGEQSDATTEQERQRLQESQQLLRSHGAQMRAAALLVDRGELDLAQELLDTLEADVVRREAGGRRV